MTMTRMGFLFVALILAVAVFAGSAAAAATDTSAAENVIHASGSGTVTGTPDRVQIVFGVETENPDVKVAQADNAARMNAVIDALVAVGVPKDQMKTVGYTIYPVYMDTSSSILDQKVKTYHVTNTLQVTLKDVNQTGQVIDTAISSGVNKANSIQFLLSDEQAQVLRSVALTKAVANARSDADVVAGSLGVTITGTKNVEISQGYTPVIYDSSYISLSAAGKVSQVPTPVQPGDVTVTAQVSITYTFR
jgi:uncharacterized protein